MLLSSLLACGLARAATAGATAEPVAELSVGDAIVLGLVEGVTEFLPISSTGHLIIANQILGLELIQVGAIAAVVLLYWQSLLDMAVGLLGRSSSGLRLFRNIVLAVLPVAVIGLLANDWITRKLFSVPTVTVALVGGALLMLWADRWRRQNSGIGFARNDPSELAPRKAVFIGFAQCVAMFPGTSRSMMTIVGGYLAGLSPAKAAEFSFLVGLPTLAGAALLKGWKSGGAMIEVFGWPHVVLGGLVAAVSAVVAVKFLVNFLTRHGLAVFAYYRLVLALVLVLFSLV
ncbi:MAG: undecaprenyl-diphosphate phosphatase [Opitutae bacterium]|nr:undecaprenyl-diphosphate phosphatase [Opitutae bacterium]